MPNHSRLMAYALFLSLAACSGGSNSRLDYKEGDHLVTLDMPPGLVAPVNTGEQELPSRSGEDNRGGVLPHMERIRIAHDGLDRWLVVDSAPEVLWPRLQSFWATLGLEIQQDHAEIGIMETAWAENRADAPGGGIAGWIRSILPNVYSADTRDKYRLRLERSESGGSEVYVTHYGLKEVVIPSNDVLGGGDTRWQVRPSDRELSNEVLNRLVLYLGGSEGVAEQARAVASQTAPRARIEGDLLVIDEGFARSWRRTGIALDSIGLVVEDRDRSQGIYYVSQVDLLPKQEGKGWFSSLFSSDEKGDEAPKQLQVRLHGDEERTELTILNMDGTPRQDELAGEMLKRLQQELK